MNGLDGQFCRQCGKPIPADDLSRARQEMLDLIADGDRLMVQNRLSEAMTIASASLEADPNCGPAVALYGEVLFRQGRTSEAVEAFEHLVRLAPENEAHKARLGEMQAFLKPKRSSVRMSQPMQILVTAVGFTLILSAVGTALILSTAQPKANASMVASNTKPLGDSFHTPAPVPAPDITGPNTGRTTETADPTAPAVDSTATTTTTIPNTPIESQPNRIGTAKVVDSPAFAPKDRLTPTGPRATQLTAPPDQQITFENSTP
ncbi:MAG: tetratricopeptide repeat protein, partial [Armatimonadota bacterium]